MPLSSESERRAVDAVSETIRLLDLANTSVRDAQEACRGELLDLAVRMSRHLRFLRNVAELLGHEIAQQGSRPVANVLPFPRASSELCMPDRRITVTVPGLLGEGEK
jgi:hypothetical protein